MLKIDVFIGSHKRDVFVEVPEYPDTWSLLSALGGSLSIFTGLSFIALVEILELTVDLAWVGGKKIKSRLRMRRRRAVKRLSPIQDA